MSSVCAPGPEIRLPEGGLISRPLAGPATRFLAWLVDLLGSLVLLILVNSVVGMRFTLAPDEAAKVSLWLLVAVPILYSLGFEACWSGQTPGKRIYGLQVMDARGSRVKLWQVFVRNLLRVVDALPGLYLVGGIACFVTARGQRLGDLAAATVVVVRPAGSTGQR